MSTTLCIDGIKNKIINCIRGTKKTTLDVRKPIDYPRFFHHDNKIHELREYQRSHPGGHKRNPVWTVWDHKNGSFKFIKCFYRGFKNIPDPHGERIDVLIKSIEKEDSLNHHIVHTVYIELDFCAAVTVTQTKLGFFQVSRL